tara:strand:+ start:182 stop:376 length:195 start_codon:yes stop_codon:yes gene_type:complete
MGQVKKLLIEAESLLVTCLDDWGMTNDQAFVKIRKQLGSMAEDHVRELVNKWNKEDKNGNSTIQ